MTKAQTTSDPDTSGALVSPQRRNFVFLAIVLGMLLAALDQTIVATALPTIVADLGGAGHQSWVVTSYLLASTIITALVGRLGDLFGRKAIFQAAVTFFVAGSVLCGLSQSLAMLVGARALQGIGGGAITVTATALIGFGFAIFQYLQHLQQIPGARSAYLPDAPQFLGLALISCGILALVISLWQYLWTVRYLWDEPFAPIAGVTEARQQTPVLAVAIVLILIGLFAFFAVLLQLA